jgi:hypothetical protein
MTLPLASFSAKGPTANGILTGTVVNSTKIASMRLKMTLYRAYSPSKNDARNRYQQASSQAAAKTKSVRVNRSAAHHMPRVSLIFIADVFEHFIIGPKDRVF